MLSIRVALSAALLTAALAVTAHAQMPSPPAPSEPATTGATAGPSTTDEVKTWTRKKYNATRAEWVKDKVKWAGCRKDAKAQRLRGRANWSFLYSCMKS